MCKRTLSIRNRENRKIRLHDMIWRRLYAHKSDPICSYLKAQLQIEDDDIAEAYRFYDSDVYAYGNVLARAVPLATESDDLFTDLDSDIAETFRQRGARAYYGGFAHAGENCSIVVISQQPDPASKTRLEVYSCAHLRNALNVQSGDTVQVDVFHQKDWNRLYGRSANPHQ